MTPLLFLAGLVPLVVGAELLVRGASSLARRFGIPPLVIGLTIVAMGTSAPEVAVSVSSALAGQADIAVGNVVGSNIFNVLFILGLSALITPLVVSRKLVWLEVPIMIGVALLLWMFAHDGRIARWEAGLLFAGLVAYIVFQIWEARREGIKDEELAHGDGRPPGSVALNLLFLAGGLGLLVLGANWLVDAAVQMARAIGVSELVIGLTIVAAGTSAPEVATSIMAAIRGERDIAVGNVVGSGIFNILGVLGIAGVVSPSGIGVAPAALVFDIPVMVAVSVACLPIFLTGHTIARWEGALFFSYYVAYTAYLILAATQHDALPAFSQAMLLFVLPLTAVTLLVLMVRALRDGRGAAKRA
jgi:cation:H+ antiporter